MPKLPGLSSRELVGLLIRDGFQRVRQKGSHVSLQKGKLRTVVPLHDDLSPGTLLAILRQCNLSRQDLEVMLRKK